MKSPNFQNIFEFLKVKKGYELSEKVAVSKHQHLLFLGSVVKNIISCEFFLLLVKLCFSLNCIIDFTPNPDPDPDPDPHH